MRSKGASCMAATFAIKAERSHRASPERRASQPPPASLVSAEGQRARHGSLTEASPRFSSGQGCRGIHQVGLLQTRAVWSLPCPLLLPLLSPHSHIDFTFDPSHIFCHSTLLSLAHCPQFVPFISVPASPVKAPGFSTSQSQAICLCSQHIHSKVCT